LDVEGHDRRNYASELRWASLYGPRVATQLSSIIDELVADDELTRASEHADIHDRL
jgi:hypothetical protein